MSNPYHSHNLPTASSNINCNQTATNVAVITRSQPTVKEKPYITNVTNGTCIQRLKRASRAYSTLQCRLKKALHDHARQLNEAKGAMRAFE